MTKLADNADYDGGETSGNVPCRRSDSGNYHMYGLQTRYVPLGLSEIKFAQGTLVERAVETMPDICKHRNRSRHPAR
ncbi:unnamed protein product [Protopolystoma xenopodis]|uniref:Uncharacterized protein n=1 Tax=Protopolystoma xenopodis TaxID=117903 RepID=A0A448XIQ7_9PLAT|nr:unnamed protein product [Protopolystoma xenopodis]